MTNQTVDKQPQLNTDRELWREIEGNYYAASLHVTTGGGIGINCGGTVFVKSLREWHRLAASEGLDRRIKFSIGDRVQSVIAPEKHGMVTSIILRTGGVVHYQVCWAEDLRDGNFHDFELASYASAQPAGFTPASPMPATTSAAMPG